MVIALCLRWWYSAGFLWIWRHAITGRLASGAEFFSLSLLFSSLFAPFKQTTGIGGGGGKLNAIIDATVSRFVGFGVRSLLILAGLLYSLFVIASGLVALISWPLVPILPVISILLGAKG